MVGGNSGLNCHLSELLSHIIEPIATEANGSEVDSTNEMICRLEELNSKIRKLESDRQTDSQMLDDVQTIKSSPKAGINTSTLPTEENSVPLEKSQNCKSSNAKKSLKRRKNDIRFYGTENVKCKSDSKEKQVKQLKERVETLRKSTLNGGLLPNISERLLASSLLDRIDGEIPIVIPDAPRKSDIPLHKEAVRMSSLLGLM